MKPRSPIKARSAKRARLMRTERVPLVRQMLAGRPLCELYVALEHAPAAATGDTYKACRGYADCVHERRKRSQGGSLLNRDNLAVLCSPCNSAIESDADIARIAHEVGLVVRRGDPGWAELGADRD